MSEYEQVTPKRGQTVPTCADDERVEVCRVCRRYFVRKVGRRKNRCGECGHRAVISAVNDLRKKSGPAYERYRLGQLRYMAQLQGEQSGTPPPTP